HTDGVGTTRLAGAFDLTRPLNPAVGQLIQAVIDKGYRDFTGKVAAARGRSQEQIDAVGRGRVWSGAQAQQRGLVDAFGGLDAALTDAARRAKLGKPDAWRVRYMEKAATPFERFFTGFAGSRLGTAWLRESPLLRGIAELAAPQMHTDLRLLHNALSNRRGPVQALAYCFCGL
ncbi:MAG TPA: S49 family peptidase, partial [Xanthomonadaceae bacterium]|nr:S49 family peptidase [Xanthomonadaceae bacterium]